jgi:hypothetical protein
MLDLSKTYSSLHFSIAGAGVLIKGFSRDVTAALASGFSSRLKENL